MHRKFWVRGKISGTGGNLHIRSRGDPVLFITSKLEQVACSVHSFRLYWIQFATMYRSFVFTIECDSRRCPLLYDLLLWPIEGHWKEKTNPWTMGKNHSQSLGHWRSWNLDGVILYSMTRFSTSRIETISTKNNNKNIEHA